MSTGKFLRLLKTAAPADWGRRCTGEGGLFSGASLSGPWGEPMNIVISHKTEGVKL